MPALISVLIGMLTMILHQIDQVAIKGIATVVPAQSFTIEDEYLSMGRRFVDKTSQGIGVYKRHIAPSHITSSDIASTALDRLLNELLWEKTSIDVLIFITQTPDYIIPGTSFIIHQKFHLNRNTLVFDINMGCSGYIHGLWLLGNLLKNSGLKRGVLIVADTISKVISKEDRSLQLLFGDAASATALEYEKDATKMSFYLANDGVGYQSLMIPKGLFRKNTNFLHSEMLKRNSFDLYMDGVDITNFVLKDVPDSINEFLMHGKIQKETIDYWVLHQANKVILDMLAVKINIPIEKHLLSIEQFGNTSSASIPLTMSYKSRNITEKKLCTLMLAGFGVGLSWGIVHVQINSIILPDIIYSDG